MHAYSQTRLLEVLISQANRPGFKADPALQAAYNKQRFNQAMRSLRSRNIFLYTEGSRPSTNLNSTNTIYTQPAGVCLLVLGYSDNLRYGAVNSATLAGPNPAEIILPQMHRVRIVGPMQSVLVEDLVPAQAGVSGQPRYTQTRFVSPVILEADQQFAIDLAYDTAEAAAAATILPQAFVFFCLKVKDKLTSQDCALVAEIQAFIRNHDFQIANNFNCAAIDSAVTGIDIGTSAGARVFCQTQPANAPTLITGIGMTLSAVKLKITDTIDGSSFSLDRFMQSSALNMPPYENSAQLQTYGAPVVAPIWTGYYQLPVPHLLVQGAQLQAEIVNGGDAGAGANSITDQNTFTQLVFQGITV